MNEIRNIRPIYKLYKVNMMDQAEFLMSFNDEDKAKMFREYLYNEQEVESREEPTDLCRYIIIKEQ